MIFLKDHADVLVNTGPFFSAPLRVTAGGRLSVSWQGSQRLTDNLPLSLCLEKLSMSQYSDQVCAVNLLQMPSRMPDLPAASPVSSPVISLYYQRD